MHGKNMYVSVWSDKTFALNGSWMKYTIAFKRLNICENLWQEITKNRYP